MAGENCLTWRKGRAGKQDTWDEQKILEWGKFSPVAAASIGGWSQWLDLPISGTCLINLVLRPLTK